MDASSGGEEKWLVYWWILKVDLLLCECGKSEKKRSCRRLPELYPKHLSLWDK